MTFNKEQAEYDNNELVREAMKDRICLALTEGPCFSKELAVRVGTTHNASFVKLLHEMVDNKDVGFVWTRGYKV